MITPLPKKAGNSFKGAIQYVTHDKGTDTAHRVAFTATNNLPTNDPAKAARCMAWTVLHQRELKQRAGKSATGRKSEGSVYHYTLNWDHDDKPSQTEMIEAAQETLHVLGLQDHEAVLAGHNDTDHSHIHVVVNLIHPETGMKARLGMSQRKMSEWALGYEQQRGRIVCPDRISNKNTREMMRDHKKATGHYPADLKWPKGKTREDYHRWKSQQWQIQKIMDKAERDILWTDQKRARDVVMTEMKRRMKVARAEAKEDMRPHWREHFQKQRKERQRFAKLQKHAIARAVWFLKNRKNPVSDNRNLVTGLWEALISGERNWDALRSRQSDQTAQMRQKASETAQERSQPIYEALTRQLNELREKQKQAREEQRRQQLERNKQKINADEWKRQQNRPAQAFNESAKEKETKELRELEAVFGSAAKAMQAMKKEGSQTPKQTKPRTAGRSRRRTRPRNPSS